MDEESYERGGNRFARAVATNSSDPRIPVATWVLTTVGGVLVLLAIWIATTLVGIKENVASMAATMTAQNQMFSEWRAKKDVTDERQDSEIRSLNREVGTLAGRNLRGGPSGN